MRYSRKVHATISELKEKKVIIKKPQEKEKKPRKRISIQFVN